MERIVVVVVAHELEQGTKPLNGHGSVVADVRVEVDGTSPLGMERIAVVLQMFKINNNILLY